MATNIQWTDETWNPTTGCTKISPGCLHCYIERTPPFRMAGRKFEKGHIPLQLHEDRLETPLHWRKPRRVFVNSLSDLFHDDVPDEFIDRVFAVMALASAHTFQVLTKRPERMRDYFLAAKSRIVNEMVRMGHIANAIVVERGLLLDDKIQPKPRWPLPNVWLGTSVEDQQRADERIPLLLQCPAAVRFLSCEPLLGPIDYLASWLVGCDDRHLRPRPETDRLAKRDRSLRSIDWVITGGESGPGARPCNLAWLRSVVAQCQASAVPCFVKQLGAVPTYTTWEGSPSVPVEQPYIYRCDNPCVGRPKNITRAGFRDKKCGDPSEWPEDLRVRQFPA